MSGPQEHATLEGVNPADATYTADGPRHSYALAFLIALIATRLLWNKYRTYLVDIPGPAIAAYTDLWRVYDVAKGKAHLTAIRLHQRHGPIVRTGPRHVSIADPSLIPVIYGTQNKFLKSAFYPLQSITWQRKPAMNIFSTRDPAFHSREKKRVAPAYTLTSLLQDEARIDSTVKLLVTRLFEITAQQNSVDLGHWLHFFAMDAVTELTFGTKMGSLLLGKDVGDLRSEGKAMLAYFAVCGQIPNLHNLLLGNPMIARLMRPMETWNPALVFTTKAIDRLYQHENHEASSNKSMLSRWASVPNDDPQKQDRKALVVNLATNLFAGADTTATALTAIFYFLCKHPTTMHRLAQEIDTADRAGHLSSPVTYQEAKSNLPYLTAVVKESIRMHAPVGLLMERIVPTGGLSVPGHHLPAGTIVGINPWVVNYDPTIFPEPYAFKPERWEDSGNGRHHASMENVFEFNFGAGSTKCLGRNVSWIEISKVVPELIRNFTVQLAHPDQELAIRNNWFVFQEGLQCVLTKRAI